MAESQRRARVSLRGARTTGMQGLLGAGLRVPTKEFPHWSVRAAVQTGMRGKREKGTSGHNGNVWVSTPSRVFQCVLSEWGHGYRVWPRGPFPNSTLVS